MKLSTLALGVVFIGLAIFSASAQNAKPKADAKKPAPVADEPGLPRVLLIGDSISMKRADSVGVAVASRLMAGVEKVLPGR